ncbi:MAG: crossover junction endodeoxyribonuclease RuvC [Bdellovibrio sp.]|nr:MAG: crossover junction endodeoxyribonuclease RuvC [Bdellovibrio sp.]
MVEGESQIFLGIDPGSLKTGFGVLCFDVTGMLRHMAHGVVEMDGQLPLAQRLSELSESLQTLFQKYRPHHVIVEKIFLGKSAESAFKLGHARGVVIAQAIRSGARLSEYATREVKKAVAGNGGACKDSVQKAVCSHLRLRSVVSLDASDALALAIYHSYRWTERLRLEQGRIL